MKTDRQIPELSPYDSEFAVLIAMTVRNALEDFHVSYLSDAQMAELNPIIRNAVATALHAQTNYLRSAAARKYLSFQAALVPSYWEPPQLVDDYVETWMLNDSEPVLCVHCSRTIVDIANGGLPHWTHLAADGGTNVGCRAASFTAESGWDDSLNKSRKATPKHPETSPSSDKL